VYVLIGIVGGIVAALAATRALRALLFQTAPTDVATFVAVPLVLGVTALVASAVPALRAARTDPTIVIRAE
jgi:putative ABC transport system permease protein